MSARAPRAASAAPAALAWCPHCACLDAPARVQLEEDGAVVASCARCSRSFSLGRVAERPTLRLVEPPSPAPRPKWLPVDLTELELELELEELNRAAGERRSDALEVPEGYCPRCVSPRGSAAACPACGLDFTRTRSEALQPPTWLRERWVKTWQRWTEDRLHAELLERATKSGELAALGRLYRLRLARAPGDAIAERARTEVLRRASLPLATPRSDLSTVRRRRLLAGTLALVVVLVSVVVAMLR